MQRHRLPLALALLLTMTLSANAQDRPAPAGQPGQAQGQQGQQGQQPGQQPGQAPQAPQPAGQPGPQPIVATPGPRIISTLPTVELAPVLQRVTRVSNKRFLVDGRVGPRIYLAGVDENDVTYPVLLSILRANGLAAFESEGRVNIIPDADIRFHAPIVTSDDADIPADEFVTRVVTVNNVGAAFLIPILRPLLPQSAHLAAMMDSNRIVIMDRYGNVKRITDIIRSLDVAAPRTVTQAPRTP